MVEVVRTSDNERDIHFPIVVQVRRVLVRTPGAKSRKRIQSIEDLYEEQGYGETAKLHGIALKTVAADDFLLIATSDTFPYKEIPSLSEGLASVKDKLTPRDMNSLLDALSTLLYQWRVRQRHFAGSDSWALDWEIARLD